MSVRKTPSKLIVRKSCSGKSFSRKWIRRLSGLSALLFAVVAHSAEWERAGSFYGLEFEWRTNKPCADESSTLQVKIENRRGEDVQVAFRVWNSAFDRAFTQQLSPGVIDSSIVIRPEASTCYPAIDIVWIESGAAKPPMAATPEKLRSNSSSSATEGIVDADITEGEAIVSH
jgi:hypothetical protein